MLPTLQIVYILCALTGLFLVKDFVFNSFKKLDKSEQVKQSVYQAQILPVEISNVRRYIKVSGNLTYKGFVKVKSERRGTITYLNPAQFAKKGEVILKLDSSIEEANLVKFTGLLNKAKYQLERAKERAKQPGVVAESEMKTFESEYQIALGDQKRAEAELNKMTILAPFDGKIGIYNFNLGSYINESDIVCVYVSNDDMQVDFILSEIEAQSAYEGKKIAIYSNLFGDKLLLDGVIEKVDPSTETNFGIRVRANVLSNTETAKLSANSAVTVSLKIEDDKPVPNVLQKAVEERSGVHYLTFVTPVNGDNMLFEAVRTPVELKAIWEGLAILELPPGKSGKSLFYAVPKPGINFDGAKIIPTEDSKIEKLKPENSEVPNQEKTLHSITKEQGRKIEG